MSLTLDLAELLLVESASRGRERGVRGGAVARPFVKLARQEPHRVMSQGMTPFGGSALELSWTEKNPPSKGATKQRPSCVAFRSLLVHAMPPKLNLHALFVQGRKQCKVTPGTGRTPEVTAAKGLGISQWFSMIET